MSDAVDIAIIQRVITKMTWEKDRPKLDSYVVRQNNSKALLLIPSVLPSAVVRETFEAYFIKQSATETECLQGWALFLDYKSVASLHGALRREYDNNWGEAAA